MAEIAAPRFVGLPSPTQPRAGHGSHPCQGLYWTPADNPRPRVAAIATHYNVDFAEHYMAPCLAARGIGFLGWNTRYRGNEDLFILENGLVDIGVGVRWLKEVAGAEVVVLVGNSGGGSLMGAYQAQAAGDAGLGEIPHPAAKAALEDLVPADLYVSLNAHPGRPDVLTAYLDASVVDETDPTKTDPELDPFSSANGPPYSAEFVARYRAAQVARNQRITDWAKAELARLNAAGIPDRVFPLFRQWADLRFMDAALDPSERPCPGCYAGNPAQANRSPLGLGRANTLRSWLSMWSLETSKCRGGPQLARIDVPALVVQSTADMGCFISDAHAIHDALGSADKTLRLVPGAHYFETDPAHRDHAADLIAAWIQTHA